MIMKRKIILCLGLVMAVGGQASAMEENSQPVESESPTTPRNQIFTDAQILEQRFNPENSQLPFSVAIVPVVLEPQQAQVNTDELKKKTFSAW